MANIQGFEVTTPEEIMQQVNAQLQQAAARGGQAAVMAADQQLVNSIFGVPAAKKAATIRNGLTEALESVSQKADESEIDFQIRQQAAVRSRLASVDPNIALQANDNIIRLQSEALEQKKLGISINQSEEELRNSIETAVQAKTPHIFRRTADGQITQVKKLDKDSSPEEINAELTRFQEADPSAQYVVGSGLDVLQIEDLEDTEVGGGLSKTARRKIEQELETAANLMFNGTAFMEEFAESPLALATGADAFVAAGGAIAGVKRIAGTFVKNDEEAQEDLGRFNRVDDRTGFTGQAQDLGVDSAVLKGLTLHLAYGLAKSLDPGGRLSDQDVEMAMSMLTGADPAATKRLLRRRFTAAATAMETHRTRALGGGLNGEIGREKYIMFEERRDQMFAALEELERILDGGGLLQKHKSKFGKSENERTGGGSSTTAKPKISFKVKRVN